MTMFANSLADEFLRSMKDVRDVAELYKRCFETQNSFGVICVQNDLARRPNGMKILRKVFVECVDEGWLEIGTEFAHMVATGLCTLEGIDPELENIGKQMYTLADAGKRGVVTPNDLEEWALPPRILEIKSRLNHSEKLNRTKRPCRKVVL